ncbi:hypothetical protein BUALT_Bualt01G0089900 [Buddleja alternifolia]|uniref:Zinc finger CHCC-type domain-containing protein n=1 Tax=Buddleja alternifolia TaxID=168488 RepID=A0AAV6Y5M7_9LAMI|nr:hypothetical protein BUALT_Bualt01G0089900 [Buddleja alternifolia]
MELSNEAPPIKVQGRIAACEGDNNPALGHPIEFICLDKEEPAMCKYCGLRFIMLYSRTAAMFYSLVNKFLNGFAMASNTQ